MNTEGIRFPDYDGGSLVNLMSALLKGTSKLTPDYVVTPLLPQGLVESAQNIVLCVIDGLGDQFLRAADNASFLQAHQRGSLTSVFPTTTAAAITTFLTGQAPQQHGLTGWFVNLAQAGGVVAVLPCEARDRQQSLTLSASQLAWSYGHKPIFDLMTCKSYVVSPHWLIDSAFNQAHTGVAQAVPYEEELADMFNAVAHVIQHDPARKYIYAYWPELDRLSHIYGQGSDIAARHLGEINAAVETFVSTMAGSNTLLILTADHGFMDTEPTKVITVNDHPELQACLAAPLCGEPRLAYAYVKPDKQTQFVDYIQQHFQNEIVLLRSDTLINQAAFGLGIPHPELAKRIGDYTLVMKENYVIKDWLDSEAHFFHRGVHGGVSDQEMDVPLITINI